MYIKKDLSVSECIQMIPVKIGNQAMLANPLLNNQQVIQMHPYSPKQLDDYITLLFRDGRISEAQAMDYHRSIYSEQGMSDAEVAELGLALNIREEYYPRTFNADVIKWKNTKITPLNKFQCARCQQLKDVSGLTIDHITPVSQHWNTIGYNSDRDTRNTFYNKLINLQLLCRSCNSSKGGVRYLQIPGPNFTN